MCEVSGVPYNYRTNISFGLTANKKCLFQYSPECHMRLHSPYPRSQVFIASGADQAMTPLCPFTQMRVLNPLLESALGVLPCVRGVSLLCSRARMQSRKLLRSLEAHVTESCNRAVKVVHPQKPGMGTSDGSLATRLQATYSISQPTFGWSHY